MLPGQSTPGILPLLTLSLLSSIIHVHSWSPTPAYHAASVFVEGQALYIQAGYSNSDSKIIQQSFSIDLSASFNVSSPPYTERKPGPNVGRVPNTLLQNGVDWFFRFDNTLGIIYNLQTGSTTNVNLNGLPDTIDFSAAATHPYDGSVVFPTDFSTNLLQPRSAFNFRNHQQPGVISGLQLYSIAASNSTQTVIIFGGYRTTSGAESALFSYETVFSRWTQLNATGTNPSPRQGTCMVPAHNGTKFVLFGGFAPAKLTNLSTLPGNSFSDIYVLDVATLIWTKGPDGQPKRARSGHVCAMSGDSFFAWGGVSATVKAPPEEMMSVYDLKTNTWQDQFIAPGTGGGNSGSGSGSGSNPSPTGLGTSAGSGDAGSSGSNVGAIAGGVAAAVIFLAAVLILVYRRKRANKHVPSQLLPLGDLKSKEELKHSPPPPKFVNTQYHNPVTIFDAKLDRLASLPSRAHQSTMPRSPDSVHRRQQRNEIQVQEQLLNKHRRQQETSQSAMSRSPESVHRHPQGDEIQAQEQLLSEYRRQREIQLEQQRELDIQIEKQLAEVQLLKEKQAMALRSPTSGDRRAHALPPSWKPANAYHASSVFIDGKAFYIHGGYNNTDSNTIRQTFSIDLSIPFDVSNPPYSKLKDAPNFGRVPNTLMQNGLDWFFCGDSLQATIYSLQNQSYTTTGMYISVQDVKSAAAVTIPDAGDIIIPTKADTQILRQNGGFSFQGISQRPEIGSPLYAIAPSNSARTVFVLAGYLDASKSNAPTSSLFHFNTSDSTWTQLEMKAGAPSPRQGACMVPAYNGTKMVVFGGIPATTVTNITDIPADGLSDIYVLDVASLTWTKGSDGGQERARSGHVCAVSRDTLVAWGGISRAGNSLPGQILSVYDLKSNTWQEVSSPKSGSNVGAIAGGIGAAVVLATSMFLVYKRKKAKAPSRASPVLNFGRPQTMELWQRSSPHTQPNQPHHPGTNSKLDQLMLTLPSTLHSPEAVYRQPQQDVMQTKEYLLDEYRRQREIQIQQQQELDRQIEKQLADMQMLRERQGGILTSSVERNRRGPQYWSMGSQGDLSRNDALFGPGEEYLGSEPRGPQKYHSGYSSHGDLSEVNDVLT
ncbi:hypothetical protein CPC16_007501 [Podila verticillata]|nr:hypothetical protein CPC16_007501 [Podila verticillata]